MGIPRIVVRPRTLLYGGEEALVERVGDGSIITRFDKTPLPTKPTDVVCPHFLELKWATGCPYSCAWCYLHGTLRFAPRKKRPYVKPYEKVEQHVRTFLRGVDGSGELLNAGELSDSLMYERNGRPFSKFILSLLQGQHRHKVLFVTKSDEVHHLLEVSGQEHAVVSFSLNGHDVARMFENGAPEVERRIEAGRRLSKAGYQVRVRIDPMVPVADWEGQYSNLVEDIFSAFVPERITLGSLRGLQSTINNCPDKSWVGYLSEKSNWGRRVDKQIRQLMYGQVIGQLRSQHGYSDVALCKETIEVWNALGMDYRQIKCNCIP
jgi:spore photoproduct lyase